MWPFRKTFVCSCCHHVLEGDPFKIVDGIEYCGKHAPAYDESETGPITTKIKKDGTFNSSQEQHYFKNRVRCDYEGKIL